jgi:NtrC-family two-component system sensor histidine kinase KinB
MSLKQKILMGYAVAITLMGAVVTWAMVNLWSFGQATDVVLRDYYRSINAVEKMLDALARQDVGVLLLLMGETARGRASLAESDTLFLEWLDRSRESIAVAGEREAIAAIKAEYHHYRERLMQLASAGEDEALSPKNYQESILPYSSKVKEGCLALRAMNERTMYAASEEAREEAKRVIYTKASVALLAAMIALFFSLVFAERLVLPLRRLVKAAKSISAGEFHVKLEVETSDELGELAAEFNRMAGELRRYHLMNVDRIVAEHNKGEAILASIEDGLVVFDTEGRVTGINPAGRRIFGIDFKEGDTLLCRDLLAAPGVCDIIAETAATGVQPNLPDDRRILSLGKGEDNRQYLFSATAIRQSSRKFSGVVLLLRDITRLREVERLKSEFVMAASHELRTPLTSLGMGVDLLLEHACHYLPERERDLLQTAHDEVQRMKGLVHDLLDLSKIESGRIELEFEAVPVTALFAEVQDIFRTQAALKGVTLTIDDTSALPQVSADIKKIIWVLSNLVSNALRYVDEGGHIRLAAVADKGQVAIGVSDDGIGIPSEFQAKIFEKFVRVDKKESGRTGLGLAICKAIIRAHGGDISVTSQPGHGSTFTFTLLTTSDDDRHSLTLPAVSDNETHPTSTFAPRGES